MRAVFISYVIDISSAHIDHLRATKGREFDTLADILLPTFDQTFKRHSAECACKCSGVVASPRKFAWRGTITPDVFQTSRARNAISLLICVNSMTPPLVRVTLALAFRDSLSSLPHACFRMIHEFYFYMPGRMHSHASPVFAIIMIIIIILLHSLQ